MLPRVLPHTMLGGFHPLRPVTRWGYDGGIRPLPQVYAPGLPPSHHNTAGSIYRGAPYCAPCPDCLLNISIINKICKKNVTFINK